MEENKLTNKLLSFRHRTAAAVGIFVLLAACGVGGPASDQTAPRPTATAPASMVGPSPQQTVAAAAASSSAVLTDGVVTEAELAQTYQQFLSCLEDGGAHGTYAFDVAIGSGFALDYGVKDDDAAGTHSEALYDACYSNADVARVESMFDEGHPEGPVQRETRRQRLATCLTSVVPDIAGQLTDDPSLADLESLADLLQVQGGSAEEIMAGSQCLEFSRYGERRSFG